MTEENSSLKPSVTTRRKKLAEAPMHQTKQERSYWLLRELIPDGPGYSADVKIKAINLWVVKGNMTALARELDVPKSTLRTWAKTDWWREAYKIVQKHKINVLDAKLSGIIERSLDALTDRIDNGDEVVTSDGQIVRKAMSGKDLMVVAGIASDKRDKLRNLGKEDDDKPKEETAEQKMQRMAKLFQEIADQQRSNSNRGRQAEPHQPIEVVMPASEITVVKEEVSTGRATTSTLSAEFGDGETGPGDSNQVIEDNLASSRPQP